VYKFNEYDKTITISGSYFFWIIKRMFDLLMCALLFPIMILIMVALLGLNYFYNKGPIFFIQKRMGKDCRPFNAIKFRTMISNDFIYRNYNDPLEVERITRLGHILRKLRLDELPQILNVIMGEMSLIGPRPDYYDHAVIFLKSVPDYKKRYLIRPGISGLSQIRLGYAEGINATKKKTRVDIFYIEHTNFFLEVKIFFGTILTVFNRVGI